MREEIRRLKKNRMIGGPALIILLSLPVRRCLTVYRLAISGCGNMHGK
jgi:hypothetical protein